MAPELTLAGAAAAPAAPAIPFNRPTLVGRELEHVRRAIEGGHLSGDGPFTRRATALLEQTLGVRQALLTTSCTHALEMAAILLALREGDEVIAPSFTFVSSLNAFVLRGARPVFCDVREDTLNLDERQLESLVTPRTRAIVVVHYAGVACEMTPILALAERHGLAVVEDNAHGLFGRYRGRALGTFGRFATQSFHETKNLSCGEGGALLVNEARDAERAEIVREKGTDRSRFFRGQVDKYTWVDVGSSYLPSDLLAAFLVPQLEDREQIQAARRRLWERYDAELAAWADENGARRPVVPAHCEQAYHMYYLLLPSLDARQRFIAALRARGVQAVFHYQSLHLAPVGRSFGGHDGQCPVTERVSDTLVRLPFFTGMSDDEQARVIDAVRSVRLRVPAR